MRDKATAAPPPRTGPTGQDKLRDQFPRELSPLAERAGGADLVLRIEFSLDGEHYFAEGEEPT